MAPLFFYLSLIGRGSIRFHRTGVEKRKGRKRDKRKRDRAWITGSDFFSGGNRFEGRGRWRRLWARETRLRVARAQVESEENRKVAGCWPLYTRIERSFGVDVEKRRCRATDVSRDGEKGSRVKRTELNSLLVKEGEGWYCAIINLQGSKAAWRDAN